MPVFTYRAADRGGKTVDGVMEAPDVRAVAERLHRDAYFPIRIVSQTERAPWWRLGGGGRLRQADLLTFTQQLSEKNGSNTPVSTITAWLGASYQHASANFNKVTNKAVDVDQGPAIDGVGGAAGAKLDIAGVSLVGSGYVASGLGTTLMFDFANTAVDAADKARTSWGYIAQAAYAVPATNVVVGGAWGESRMIETDADTVS